MMSALPRRKFTPEEYLMIERKSQFKSEYLDGEIYAMTGASPKHNRIVTNLIFLLESQLRERPCNVYANDMRVRTSCKGLYAYPDVVVTCGEEKFADDERDTLVNPVVLIEVLSDSTEIYDRTEKLFRYQQIPSLKAYLMISQKPYQVICYIKRSDEGEWSYRTVTDSEAIIKLDAIKCELNMREIYAKVEIEPLEETTDE
jgi:Uma2 family endonuclease